MGNVQLPYSDLFDGAVRTFPFERMTEPESLRLMGGGALVGVKG